MLENEVDIDVRPEDFRHAWPTALRNVLQLYHETLARSEEVLKELADVREQLNEYTNQSTATEVLQPAIDLINRGHSALLETLREYGRDVIGEQTHMLRDLIQSHIDNIHLQASIAQDNQRDIFVLETTRETNHFKSVLDEQTQELMKATTILTQQAKVISSEREMWLRYQEELMQVRRGSWLQRLLWVAKGEAPSKVSKIPAANPTAQSKFVAHSNRGVAQPQKVAR